MNQRHWNDTFTVAQG